MNEPHLLLFSVFIFPVSIWTAHWRQARDAFLSNMDFLASIDKRAADFGFTTRDLLGLTNKEGLVFTDVADSVQATHVIRYQQTYESIPVFDATLTVETDVVLNIYTGQVTGKIAEDIDSDVESTTPNLLPKEALQISIANGGFPLEGARIESEEPRLEIYLMPNNTARLVYRVLYYAESGDKSYRPCFMIDAQNGEVLERWNMLETTRHFYQMKAVGGNKKIGQRKYGDILPYLDVRKKGDDCIYENEVVRVINLNGSKFLNNEKRSVYHVSCSRGPNDSINGAYSPASDALFYSKVVYKMYLEWAHVAPKKKLPLIVRVHYGHNEVTAVYNGKNFTFGDGAGDFFPLVGLDVLSHEFSHCFTDEHSFLIYEGQSGGINEAFSDVAGEAAEFYHFDKPDWVSGDQIAKKPVRLLCDQKKDGKSITNAAQFVKGLDVHYSSGVYNRFACLLSTMENWNTKKVFQTMVHANRFYWHPKTDFAEGACDMTKAAYDLGFDIESVVTAFEYVGVNVCDIGSYMRNIHPGSLISGLKADEGEQVVLQLRVKVPTKEMRIVSYSGSGEMVLFVHYRKLRKSRNAQWSSKQPGNNQFVKIDAPKLGRYYVVLEPKSNSKFSGVKIKVNTTNT